MFINNLTGKPIKDISFEGYFFSIPAGVCVCWDKFGTFLLRDIYPIQGENGGVSPVTMATVAQWKGDKYVEVKRFPLNPEQVPNRKDLLKLAKQRGVDKVTIESWDEDETIENAEIAKTINELSVPDEIAYPKVEDKAEDPEAKASREAAEKTLNEMGLPETVTQAMLDENPVLVEYGVKVGDPVSVATKAEADALDKKAAAAAKGKAKGAAKKAAKKAPGTKKVPVTPKK